MLRDRRGIKTCVLCIVAHNHPSGNPQTSQEDIKLTKRLKESGELIGIELVDHIALGDEQFLSMKREGLF